MRRLSVLAVVTVLLLALAGCGQEAVAAATIVRNVPAKTEKAKTARMALSVTTSGGTGQAATVTGDGVIDIVGKRADLTMDLGQSGLGKMRVLLLGTVLYVQLPPALQAEIPGGKAFIKVDLNALSKQQGFDLGALTSQNPDASDQLAILHGAGSDFKKIGTEKIRGTTTTHYAGTVDLTKAAAAATPEQKASLDKVRQQLGSSTFPVDVWVDSQGRLRKMTSKMDMSKAAAAAGKSGAAGQMNFTVELFDYGVAVNVTEPPPDQTTDLSALLSGLGRGASSSSSGSQTKRP